MSGFDFSYIVFKCYTYSGLSNGFALASAHEHRGISHSVIVPIMKGNKTEDTKVNPQFCTLRCDQQYICILTSADYALALQLDLFAAPFGGDEIQQTLHKLCARTITTNNSIYRFHTRKKEVETPKKKCQRRESTSVVCCWLVLLENVGARWRLAIASNGPHSSIIHSTRWMGGAIDLHSTPRGCRLGLPSEYICGKKTKKVIVVSIYTAILSHIRICKAGLYAGGKPRPQHYLDHRIKYLALISRWGPYSVFEVVYYSY